MRIRPSLVEIAICFPLEWNAKPNTPFTSNGTAFASVCEERSKKRRVAAPASFESATRRSFAVGWKDRCAILSIPSPGVLAVYSLRDFIQARRVTC